jgi:potassium-dependent mechanosensitive channel
MDSHFRKKIGLLFWLFLFSLQCLALSDIYSKQLDFRLAPGVYTLVHEDASDENNNAENSSAKSINHQSTLAIADRQLSIDRESHTLVKKQLVALKMAKDKQFQSLREKGVTTNIVKHAQLDFIAAQAAVEGVNIALVDANEAIGDTDTSIHNLEKDLQASILLTKGNQDREDKIISIEANLEFLKRLQQIQSDRIKTLNEIKAITQERLKLENNWQQKLQILFSVQQQEEQQNRLSEILSHLQQQQQEWLVRLGDLTTQWQVLVRQSEITDTNLKKFHLQILEAEENIALIRLKSYLVHMQNRVAGLREMNKSQKTTTQLNEFLEQASTILVQLTATKNFVSDKMYFLDLKRNELALDLKKQVLSIQDIYAYLRMLTDLNSNYKNEVKDIHSLEKKASYYQHEFKRQLQHHLSERQKFPSDFGGWITLGQKILQIPYLLLNAFQNFIQQGILELKSLHNGSLNFVLMSLLTLFACWFYLRRFFLNVEINVKEDKQRFSTNVVYVLIELIRRNIGAMFVFSMLLVLTLSLHVSSPLFIYLLLVYLLFKIFLSAAKLTLLENISDISGKDVALYYRIRWTSVLGCLLSMLTVITHHIPVGYEIKIFANRLFMVFVLILAIQFFRARAVMPEVFKSIIYIPRRYFYRALKLVGALIPVVLFFNALIGILGYVELAWTVAKYQVISILILAGYLIAHGLLIDAMEFLSEFFIRHVKQGWLWTESFLKPLDRVFRIVLFTLSIGFSLHLFHLDDNEFFMNSMNQFLHRRLFFIAGNPITLLLLCELLVILSLIKWLAYWSREFSYRWLYVKAKDLGVRNSLAIFTQYTSVVVSVLIALKFLGIDLRGFTVVAAAFAAGIGFGMRDLIVNFFSGILLLIERPFRSGDIITLGNYEGEVILTGMRSMTIRTWDHMEVIVPNADMFTKPFVNWTHHDNIVRTVITLKIHRDDDPYKVQILVLNLLNRHPSVAREPLSEVIMNELHDSLIEMQVRYYVLLTPQRTRAGVRSEVLFAIWDCFKENNIRAPHPQYDLVVKNSRKEEIFAGTTS